MAGVAGQVVTDQWECPHEAPRWKVWPLLHRLECISPNRKNHILITFYFISVFFFNPPLLCSSLKTSSSPSTSPLNTELPLHLPFSVLESDCLFSQIVVHSLLALSVSFLNPSHPRSLIWPLCHLLYLICSLSLKPRFLLSVMSLTLFCCSLKKKTKKPPKQPPKNKDYTHLQILWYLILHDSCAGEVRDAVWGR